MKCCPPSSNQRCSRGGELEGVSWVGWTEGKGGNAENIGREGWEEKVGAGRGGFGGMEEGKEW